MRLALRNWKIFSRDRGTVFFSLLGPIIIVGLYIVFLKGATVADLNVAAGTENNLVNSWVMAGIVASASVTTCLAGYGIMIRDREDGIARDFDTAPVSKWTVIGSYMLNSLIIGLVMSAISFAVAIAYIAIEGGSLPSIAETIGVLAIIVAAVFSAAGVLAVIASFISTESAFSGANIVIGAAIGFLVGAYIPIGNLPDAAQGVLKLVPATHAARALRTIMMDEPIDESFAGAPAPVIDQFRADMGVTLALGDRMISLPESIGYLLITGLIGFALAVPALTLKRRTR